jgi:DNA (cytosine-5)-methyltransferase 1
MRTVAFCEIEPYARAVLRKHWPNVPIYDDVRTLTAGRLVRDGIAIDVICGGFPCQDISVAGKGAGLAGERSGLWSEYARIIGEARPRYIIVENVAALLGRGLGRVLGDLAALGYDAEWHCIPASAVGAPHRRDRLWIVAYTNEVRSHRRRTCGAGRLESANGRLALANADICHEHGWRRPLQMGWGAITREITDARDFGRTQWGAEPDVGRVAHGIPSRVDRLRSLGNAVVPQIPEMIGRAIMTDHANRERKLT